jgi:HSP20 family protein
MARGEAAAVFDPQSRWTTNLGDLQREMERYLQYFSQRKPRTVVFSQRVWVPAIDVFETEEAVVALVDLAGVSQEDIDLVVGPTSLTVRGVRKDVGERTERRYTNLEIPFGPFERTVEFSARVNPDGTTASYRMGFLEVFMPKQNSVGIQRVTVKEP